MMNALALALVFTSLLTAGFFTPAPQKDDNIIVKQGHRVVVVEYEKGDGNTKVSISPQGLTPSHQKPHDAKDKLKEASSSLLSQSDQEEEIRSQFSPTKLVCDAYGKCRRVIASTVGKAKETAHGAANMVSEAEEDVKDTVNDSTHKASDNVQEAKESVKDIVGKAKEKSSERTGEIKEGVKGEAEEMADRAVRAKEEEGMKEILRRARDVGTDAVASVVQLMGFAAAYGMCVWVTFASSYVLGGALPRQQFGMVQSRIYPVYFKSTAYCVGMALLGHLLRNGRSSVGSFQSFNLATALVMVLGNLMYLEPRATKVMVERMKKEKEEGGGRRLSGDKNSTAEMESEMIGLSSRLQRLNSYSSLLNVATLLSLTCHLLHLAHSLH